MEKKVDKKGKIAKKIKIKKGKITITVTIGIACFALALVMFMQFKVVNETDITSIETMRESELQTELADWKSKYEEVSQQYDETVKKIDEYNQTKQSNAETNALVDSEIEQANMLLGKTDLEGPGITITLKEGTDVNSKYTSDNLLIIVNSLKLAGAEAISINDQRIINMSDIVTINLDDADNFYIKVNGERILAPYTIKAIGDQTYLESGLLGNGGCIDDLKKTGHDVIIENSNKIEIKRYDGEIKTKYIE